MRNWWDLDFEGTADNLHNNLKQNINAVAFAILDKKIEILATIRTGKLRNS